MRRLRHIFVVLAFVGVLSVWSPAGALANGCHGSAGDSQYVDPLQNCNPPASSHTGGSSGGSTSGQSDPGASAATAGATAASRTPTASTASATTTTNVSTTAPAKDPASSKTLPVTGLDLVPALIVAVVMLGGGLLLRRLVAD